MNTYIIRVRYFLLGTTYFGTDKKQFKTRNQCVPFKSKKCALNKIERLKYKINADFDIIEC